MEPHAQLLAALATKEQASHPLAHLATGAQYGANLVSQRVSKCDLLPLYWLKQSLLGNARPLLAFTAAAVPGHILFKHLDDISAIASR